VWLTLSAWALGLLLLCAYLLASHLVALPVPSQDNPGLMAALEQSRSAQERGRWLMVHVIYGDCPCSMRVVDHLLERELAPGTRERMLLVGEDPGLAARMRSHGYRVEEMSAQQLKERYEIEGVPLLVIADPAGRLRYVGGYTARKQGPDIQDTKILAELRADRSIASLPLFGCAVSRELREALNPLERVL
jgi:hypothetical protein